MTPAEALPQVLKLLRGGDLNLGGTVVRMQNGGPLELVIDIKDGRDVRVEFVGKKPTASAYAMNFTVHELVFCVKGVKAFASFGIAKITPFILYEDMNL